MKNMVFTGVADDDRRIAAELQAMGAFDQPLQSASRLQALLEPVAQFLTWMRWKGEYSVYGCRVGATEAYRMELKQA